MQDFSQLKKDYGGEQADVIMNICGNVISGQVMGDTSKMLAERFGKIMQVKDSFTVNRNDTSFNKSTQMDFAIPQSKIASLSSGEFVGMVADDPNEKIKLKTFHCEIVNDHTALQYENIKYKTLPSLGQTKQEAVRENYKQIKNDIIYIIKTENEILMNSL
jgi:hypothetical protein